MSTQTASPPDPEHAGGATNVPHFRLGDAASWPLRRLVEAG